MAVFIDIVAEKIQGENPTISLEVVRKTLTEKIDAMSNSELLDFLYTSLDI
jgi:hypothetical protein